MDSFRIGELHCWYGLDGAVYVDKTVCPKCGAHGAPDKCWNCGYRKDEMDDFARMAVGGDTD